MENQESKPKVRAYARAYDQIRPLKVTYDITEHAAASVLFELGKTKVLCAVSLIHGVPPFLKGKKTGWLTAEYGMLPTATHIRKERETGVRPNGRSMEISRLIGRALRSTVKLELLGERTIIVDCDVIQADGSTRTAGITGAHLALRLAMQRWLKNGVCTENILGEDVAAISVGKSQQHFLLDLDFNEDSSIDADFNFVITRSGNLIEIQGSAERLALPWSDIETMYALAYKGIQDIFHYADEKPEQKSYSAKKQPFNAIRVPTSLKTLP